MSTLRDEAATQLSSELADLTPEERAVLGAAVPVLRQLADRHLGDRAIRGISGS